MIQGKEWQPVRDFIRDKHRIAVTTHIHPDGDAIGSQMAMAHYLRQIGKEVVLLNCDVTPEYFHFLDPGKEIGLYSPQLHETVISGLDGCLVVDISDWGRLRALGEALQRYRIPLACIDHHIPAEQMGEVHICLQEASSTGEMIYDFLLDSGAELTPPIVDALYTCVMTDTGSFRFNNTTARTHLIAADLLGRGAHYRAIYEQVYENNSKQRTLLMAKLLEQMHFACDDRLAYFSLSQALLRQTGAQLWETEGFSELPRTIAKVEVSLMFTETLDGSTKVSFRSKGRVAINGMAALFGGGGHKFASGATLAMSLNQAVEVVVEEAKKLFKE
ncbi:MAG TPA: bifunctional oligoribonuclease/PAP phosphatase NrnA [bacterium]|nr:bifunctional oligoribonuclease/PAP phosphatase NrnA [bacterium]HQI48188.1 bifunctional oligoribonuclease/PAP phosphatase NrnA [bacterium]HQJ64551.1 bifunctional oligoribonuclease/PAP phosphatase NrnA [bacterium]